MATGRINKKVLDHIAAINKEAKEMQLSKNMLSSKVKTKVKQYDRNSCSFTYDY